MPTIRVDTEVMDALKTRAVEEGLVFRTPNDVLRSVLALEVKTEGNLQNLPCHSNLSTLSWVSCGAEKSTTSSQSRNALEGFSQGTNWNLNCKRT